VVSLPPGQAATFTDGMDRPILLRIPHGQPREHRLASPPTVATTACRTAACGPVCQGAPCSTRAIGNATALLADSPQLTLWVELLTVAHVAGLPRPVPLFGPLFPENTSDRLRECAVAEAVTRAVGARSHLVRADYAPDTLAEHLADTVTRALAGGAPACPVASEIHWQAGRYRFADVPQVLYHWQGRRDRLHPMTSSWQARGLDLHGSTIEEQLLSYAVRAGSRLPAAELLWGDGQLSAAIDELSGAPDPTSRLIAAASRLHIPDAWHHYVFDLATTADTSHE
jgi:hypothetical protein